MNRHRRPFYQVNERIRASELRILDSEGQNLGILNRHDALNQARALELDLVLINEKSTPPVAKIIAFDKYKYEQQKAEAKRRKVKTNELKQLRFKPNIDEHDLQVRIRRAREFLQDGDMVKFVIPFFGRSVQHKQIGEQKLDRLWESLQDIAAIEKDRWMDKKFLTMIIKPK